MFFLDIYYGNTGIYVLYSCILQVYMHSISVNESVDSELFVISWPVLVYWMQNPQLSFSIFPYLCWCKTSLTLPHLIEVCVPIHESELLFIIFVCYIYFTSISVIFLFDFGIALTVWCFFFPFSCIKQNFDTFVS
jgi:hypothetical protein